MITKEQLQTMSDVEVDAALASIVYKKVFTPDEIKNLIDIGNIPCGYCKTPNDIMLLAFEHEIGLAPNKDSWEAFTLMGNYLIIQNQYVDTNPLRAIACCLILVLQEKQK